MQDQANILWNLFHEYLVHGAPVIYHKDKAIVSEAIKKLEARPFQHLPVNMGDSPQMENLFYTSPTIEVPASLVTRLNDITVGAVAQFVTGIFPALQGAGMPEGMIQGDCARLREAA